MERITPSVREDHIEMIDRERESNDDVESDAQAVRNLLDRAAEVDRIESEMEQLKEQHAEEVQQLESEIESLEARNDELTNKLASVNQRIDASNDLVRAVEQEQTLATKRAQASIGERLKWWLSGMPVDDQEASDDDPGN